MRLPGPGTPRGFSVSFFPVGLPRRASSRMALSTSTSTSPRAASTQTPGRRPFTAGSRQSTCHGVSTPTARLTPPCQVHEGRQEARHREAGVGGLGSSPTRPLSLCGHL